jgi:hypothetical protein
LRELLIKMLTPSQPKPKLTTEEFEVRVWGFVVVAITVILFGIVFALLYSVTFVTQPIKSMAPIDQAYTKMLNDIVLLIVGGIGGIGYGMPNSSYASPQSAYGLPSQPFGAMPVWKNPELDESWTPGPPPTTPPEHMEPDEDREEIAAARKEVE